MIKYYYTLPADCFLTIVPPNFEAEQYQRGYQLIDCYLLCNTLELHLYRACQDTLRRLRTVKFFNRNSIGFI